MILRDYQEKLKTDIYSAWDAGFRNVLAVAPCRSGKTAIKARIFKEKSVPGVAIAHRQELVSQISKAVAEAGVYHRIIASQSVINFCIAQHIKLFGRSFHHAQSPMAVAGVDTLLRRQDMLTQWINQVRIWDIDEAHHVLKLNKWGKAVDLFKNAHGVGFTATPVRCDKKALGATKQGVFNQMVIGPTMRELINRGYLCEYQIFGPPVSIHRENIAVSESSGELNYEQLRKEARQSTITGDIVEHYLKLTPGKVGITFCVDVELATDTAAAFRQKGVPAEVVTADTPETIRQQIMEKHARGDIKQVTNVDLFGEGVDVPRCEVVSMGRPTESYPLYVQQFCRSLTPSPGKTTGILIDHVDNVKKHRLPDAVRRWSLDDEPSKKSRKVQDDDALPISTCTTCFRAFEAVTKVCPFCGAVQAVAGRSLPEQVDGDLTEYGPELLDALRREIGRIDGPAQIPANVNEMTARAIKRNWNERSEAQAQLRDCIGLWCGVQREVYQRQDSEIFRRFYHKFGIDIGFAQALGRSEAEKLTQHIRETFI